ncbi:hypothetical protein BKA82DRAFT_1003103, partial [Pisolithus tinctorius]
MVVVDTTNGCSHSTSETRSSREELGKPNCATVSGVKDGEHGSTKPLRRSVVHFTRSI